MQISVPNRKRTALLGVAWIMDELIAIRTEEQLIGNEISSNTDVAELLLRIRHLHGRAVLLDCALEEYAAKGVTLGQMRVNPGTRDNRNFA
jgi:hypothetical protein